MSFKMELLEHCTDAQKSAITHPCDSQPILILAGAGTGKTSVLTLRVHYLCCNKVEPSSIVALTFTRKASIEMRERIGEHHSGAVNPVECSTFHAFAYKILCESVHGVPNYSCLGFLDKPSILEDTSENAKDTDNTIVLEGLVPAVIGLFTKKPEILKYYRDKIQHLLIDEYQDVNDTQYMFTKLLLGSNKNLFVVGDDDQAIYGFRGANVQNIFNFKRDYSDAQIIKLEDNFRSTPQILALANRVFINKDEGFSKQLVSKGERDSLLFNRNMPVNRVDSKTGITEVRAITQRIEQLRSEYAIQYSDCVILVRLNVLVDYYSKGLCHYGVPTKEGKEIEGNAVIVQTIHASKGLQYPVVFYCCLNNGITPYCKASDKNDESVEEERRLFYVGITRAESMLFLMYSKKRIFERKLKKWKPSPFLKSHKESVIERMKRKAHYWFG